MDRKRRHSSDDFLPSQESLAKKQNLFKTPPPPRPQTPQNPLQNPQNKLPLGTPTTVARYGINVADTTSLVSRIDTFATLIKCVAHIVESCGESYEEDKRLGSYIIDAVNAVTVRHLSICGSSFREK